MKWAVLRLFALGTEPPVGGASGQRLGQLSRRTTDGVDQYGQAGVGPVLATGRTERGHRTPRMVERARRDGLQSLGDHPRLLRPSLRTFGLQDPAQIRKRIGPAFGAVDERSRRREERSDLSGGEV